MPPLSFHPSSRRQHFAYTPACAAVGAGWRDASEMSEATAPYRRRLACSTAAAMQEVDVEGVPPALRADVEGTSTLRCARSTPLPWRRRRCRSIAAPAALLPHAASSSVLRPLCTHTAEQSCGSPRLTPLSAGPTRRCGMQSRPVCWTRRRSGMGPLCAYLKSRPRRTTERAALRRCRGGTWSCNAALQLVDQGRDGAGYALPLQRTTPLLQVHQRHHE